MLLIALCTHLSQFIAAKSIEIQCKSVMKSTHELRECALALFHHYFEQSVRKDPQKVAVTLEGKSATYAELDVLAKEVAGELAEKGIHAGDRVAIYGDFSIRLLGAVLSIFKAGAILVTVHHTFGPSKLMFQVQDSGARALITDRSHELQAELSEATLIVLDVNGVSLEAPIARGGAGKQAHSQSLNVADDNIAVIFYTSGSTARPKGVAVNHRNMIAAFDAVSGYLENTSSDVVLSYSTLASDYGFYNVMMPLMFGGTAVVERALPPDPDTILELIEKHGVTALHVFPPVIFHLLKATALYERIPRSLRYISSSGQVLPIRHIRCLREAWPDVKIFSNYGLTECKRVAFLPPEEIDIRPESVGRPVPGVRTYLAEEDGGLVTKAGQVGELVVAGDLLMQRYWNMPEETARRLHTDIFGEERVFFTGDLFRTDDNGYLYYVARKDDVFARNLFKVNPREIERLLMLHEAVSEAAVIPVPDDSAGHVPKALIVIKSNTGVTATELIDYCSKHLDWHMVPVFVEFVDELPRTLSGKTAVRALS
ncbi:class I adenylate-forming enzyme family protein [Agrobacterium vitis]|uniref:class I adenylate-forming enzyme family protein n=1 Tax=Agrobacterium vitis TaxID=373 RepID=UPI001F43C41A|nr:class I adenylate-forming enzyme family protein [Agrobacterium vitis]